MEIAEFDQRDLASVTRIWKEVGWVDDARADYVADFIQDSDCAVIRIGGEAECAVICAAGEMRFQEAPATAVDLSMCGVTAVTTSHVARRLGAARKLTAHALAKHGEAGVDVAALGMFDQGFYDTVGFGTGAYTHWLDFDPAKLRVDRAFRPPRRLTKDDWSMIRGAMWCRDRGHGGAAIVPDGFTRAEIGMTEKPFGLGYCDGPGGELTHFLWGTADDEHGPYRVELMGYQSADQLFELLALIRSLGDQVASISMHEPREIQLQDLLEEPFRNARLTRGSRFASGHRSNAWWQMRILNLESCLAKTRLGTSDVRFNLEIEDPVLEYLDAKYNWPGVAGSYVVTLGEKSSGEKGEDAGLPTLRASVGAFSRLWFGIRPASSLALTDRLDAPASLLAELDHALRLPRADLGWGF